MRDACQTTRGAGLSKIRDPPIDANMQIIAGTAKGRKIRAPKGRAVIRPALSQVREAIFSSLGQIEGGVFLDLYAGTGSLGLEALSRGAGFVYFVENHKEALRLIIQNLKDLGFAKRAHVYRRHLPKGLVGLNVPQRVDVVFCDPPYDKGLLVPTLEVLSRQKAVDHRTTIIVEHTKREMPQVKGLIVKKERRFGQTIVSYLKIASNDEQI